MTCEELQDSYELHALGLLEDPERAELEEHLRRGCPNCTPGLRRARLLNTAVLSTAPDVEPPAHLRAKVLASVAPPQRAGYGRILRWSPLFAALLLVAVSVAVSQRWHEEELAEREARLEQAIGSLSEAQRALALLNQPETRQVIFGEGAPQPPRGRVFINPDDGVLLLAGNLPPLPPGKTYQFWVIPKGGAAPSPAGLFQSDESGNAVHLYPQPVNIAQTGAVAVSVEPEAGSPAPTTTPIIVAPLGD